MKKLVLLAVVVTILVKVILTASAFTPTIQVQSTAIGMGEFREDVFANIDNKMMKGETYMKPLTINYINTSKIFVASNESVGMQGFAIFKTAKQRYCVRNYDIGVNVGFAAVNTTQSQFTLVTETASAGIQLQGIANGEIKTWTIVKEPVNHTSIFNVLEDVKGLNVQLNYSAQIAMPDFVAGEVNESSDWLSCP